MNNTHPHLDFDRLPALSRDHSFWGMTATQFLGAFNDNLFKQLILLICVEFAARRDAPGDVYQTAANGLFALPFVLFSGFAGYLSDRTGKQSLIVLCKMAEIGVMLAGMAVFLSGDTHSHRLIYLLFAVLFLMGTQSAFFGPPKYGILPEMIRGRDLPQANGIIQMTTFLAIIFGTALAGLAKEWFENNLWVVNAYCVGIAVVGTATSLSIRKPPVAHPGLRFSPSTLAVSPETRTLLWKDRPLLVVLLISSLFWFLGGVTQLAINPFGKIQMDYGDARTSFLVACVGIGIAAGCILAGRLSRGQVRFELVSVGAWGICLTLLTMSGLGVLGVRQSIPPDIVEWLSRITLIGLGLFAGLFAVPLQVFLQSRPPEGQKGRMIGAMNLINWVGILAASLFFYVCTRLLDKMELPVSWTFAAAGMLILPVALFYRPRDEDLE
jgi:MFS family permease